MPSHLGTNPDEMGGVLPSKIEQQTYEKDLYAHRYTEIPTNMQGRWLYDGSNNCIYAAYAPRGLAENVSGWLLHKLTWVGTNCTSRQIAYDSFLNCTLASYI